LKLSNRILQIPKYIFSRLEEQKNKLCKNNIEVIDLSIGDPDIRTPDFIKEELIRNLNIENYYKYPSYSGVKEFKIEVANFYKRHFGVELDYENEVGVLIGAKEGLAHIFLALIDPGDYCLIPEPSYPVYNFATIIAGGIPYKVYLSDKEDYLPNISKICPEVCRKAKLFIVNYPNNPTGACANLDFYNELIEYGIKNDIIIINDAAYSNIICDDKYKISLLQAKDAKKIAAEIGSLSKNFNMTGWRIGYIVGNREIIKRLLIIKSNMDSGQFIPIQLAGACALREGDNFIKSMNDIYNVRRKLVSSLLNQKQIEVYNSKGTFYVWFKVPNDFSSQQFCEFVLNRAHVMLTPGEAFGKAGEKFCRLSLTADFDKLKLAIDKICGVL